MALQAQPAVVKREPLLLPAPAVTIEIPGINSIPTNTAVAEMVAVRGD